MLRLSLVAVCVAGSLGTARAQQVALQPDQPVAVVETSSDDWTVGDYSSSSRPESPRSFENSMDAGGGISSAAKSRNARDINAFTSIGLSYGQTVGSIRYYVFAQNRSVQLPAIVYLHPSGHLGPFRFDYMIQEIPVYLLHEPRLYDYESVALTPDKRIAFGTAILPVGERMIFNPRNRLQVSFYSNGGFSYFTRRILSEGATRFNIALQFGFDFQFAVNDHSSVIVGYADNHLSNSDIHIKNPGLDGNLIFAQYLVRLHRKKS
jgi:hypothetical protein